MKNPTNKLPPPDRAEELCRAYHDTVSSRDAPRWDAFTDDGRDLRVAAMRAAIENLEAIAAE